jgi:8-oxo-dGTP diphosphatase
MLNQNIKIAADSMIFSKNGKHLQLLLIQRGNDPFKGMWALPGGFVEDAEELEAAALRELEEETAMKLPAMKQLHSFGKVNRDPRGRTVSVTYYAFVNAAEHKVKGGDDAAEAQWVDVKDITEMAFDHMEVLEFALQQLQDELKD